MDDQPVTAWTSEGRYIEIVRDGLGREVRATASSTMDDDALRRGATETVEFTSSYDDPAARGIGRPTRSTDEAGAHELSYDAFGRPRDIAYMPSAAARGTSTALAARYTARFDYSPQGSLRAVSFLGLPQGFAVTYERDALGRPVAVRTTGGGDRSMVNPAFYDHEGRMTEAYLGNGSLTRWLYGTRSGRLDEIQHDYQQQRIESVRYEYDANSNITVESRTSEGRLTTEKTHRYDGSERLVQTQAWSVRGGRSTQVFEYSPGGNILRAGATGEAYEYGNEANPQAVTKVTDERGLDRELAYDRDGYLVRDVLQQGSRREERRFSVDGAGCIQQAAAVVTDGNRTYENTTRTLCARDGRRTVRRTQNGLTGEVKTRIDFARLAEIRPEEGTFVLRVPVNGTTTAEEVRSLATGARLEEKSGFLYADVRGSVLARTSFSAGNASVATYKTEDADYDPWGKTERVSDRPLPAHQFVDHEPDPNLGLYDFGVRTYDPTLRRWLSPDPLVLMDPEYGVLSAEQLNLFQYAANNPVIGIDPLGTFSWESVRSAITESSLAMGTIGFAAGVLQGSTPGGFLAPSPYQGTNKGVFDHWRGAGMVVAGSTQVVYGTKEAAGGTAVLVTTAGTTVPVAGTATVVGVATAVNGLATIQTGRDAMRASKSNEGAGGTREASKIDRSKFKTIRENFWKAEAKNNPSKYSPEDLKNMQNGKPPKGSDGHPMELHHTDRTPDGPLQPMTRTDHRLGENYKKNHPPQEAPPKEKK
jgi:RHS repeat-associated protein